jgi:general secretion pathway protein L
MSQAAHQSHSCGYSKFIAAIFCNPCKVQESTGFGAGQMTTFLKDLFLWFMEIVRPFFAARLRRRAVRTPRQLISIGDDGIRMLSGTSLQKSETLAMADLEARLRALGSERNERLGEYVLRLERGRALVRRLSSIALPASRLRAAALLDVETATPFRPGDVHVLALRARDGQTTAGSNYAIVKRVILDPLIYAFAQAGVSITRIDIDGGTGVYGVSFADQRRLLGSAGKPGGRLAAAAMSACGLAAIATLAHVTMQYDAAIRQVESSAGQLAEEAKAVRSAMDQRALRIAEIQALRKSVEERKLVSAIWEELARVLPDSSYLTDLAVKDSNVSISGYSAAASSIIVALEGSDMFDQASFTAPVVKVPGNAGDRFAIDLKMGGK